MVCVAAMNQAQDTQGKAAVLVKGVLPALPTVCPAAGLGAYKAMSAVVLDRPKTLAEVAGVLADPLSILKAPLLLRA